MPRSREFIEKSIFPLSRLEMIGEFQWLAPLIQDYLWKLCVYQPAGPRAVAAWVHGLKGLANRLQNFNYVGRSGAGTHRFLLSRRWLTRATFSLMNPDHLEALNRLYHRWEDYPLLALDEGTRIQARTLAQKFVNAVVYPDGPINVADGDGMQGHGSIVSEQIRVAQQNASFVWTDMWSFIWSGVTIHHSGGGDPAWPCYIKVRENGWERWGYWREICFDFYLSGRIRGECTLDPVGLDFLRQWVTYHGAALQAYWNSEIGDEALGTGPHGKRPDSEWTEDEPGWRELAGKSPEL